MRGSVYKRGANWTARWDQPAEDGGRYQASKGGFATKREAQEHLATQLVRVGQGELDDRSPFDAFASRWLEAIQHEIAPTTWDGYETHLRIYLMPAIRNKRLSAVTATDLQSLYSRTLNAGKSPRTVKYIHATAHRLFADAMRWGVMYRNPAAGARPPAQEKKQKRTWTADETATFLASVAGSRWEPLYWFAADTAVRRGELISLTWPQLQDDTATIWKGKTKAARRTISLLDATLSQLRAWRQLQATERLAAGPGWESEHAVWTWGDGRPIRGDWLTHRFIKDVEAAGLPKITLHELRHSWATQALESGVPLEVVQHRLGHSSIRVTADFYTRVPQDVDRMAVRAVGSRWSLPREQVVNERGSQSP